MSEEEKKAIWYLGEILVDENDVKQWEIIENLIEKQNKIIETNKENWLLVQNEVLGYAQGYEDGKKHKQTATAMVVENRKYQIIGEEIKRYKAIIEKQQAEIQQLKEDMSNMYDEKVVRNILEDECGLSKYEIEEILN